MKVTPAIVHIEYNEYNIESNNECYDKLIGMEIFHLLSGFSCNLESWYQGSTVQIYIIQTNFSNKNHFLLF